jgi:hypothetical protein
MFDFHRELENFACHVCALPSVESLLAQHFQSLFEHMSPESAESWNSTNLNRAAFEVLYF